jgi:hypothetical protein
VIQLGLAQGTLRIRPYEIRSGSEIEVDTPNAAVTITQPGNYRIDTYPDQNTTVVTVNSGELQITGNTINQLVEAGQAVELSGTDQVQVTSVEVPGSDAFDQWADQRDARYLNSRSRRYVSPYMAGYSDLDQYGNWDTVPEYGAVWYPSSVPGGWAPYRYGRWAWVEPWGWTWVDESPWGFAPFHYGRWVQIGPRWGWLPGPMAVAPIYGPAFVAFVGGGGFSNGFGVGSVAAWFPLGPGEPYYPSYHHSDNYQRQVNVTNVSTTNITNITNVTNVNNINYRYKTGKRLPERPTGCPQHAEGTPAADCQGPGSSASRGKSRSACDRWWNGCHASARGGEATGGYSARASSANGHCEENSTAGSRGEGKHSTQKHSRSS